MRLELGLEGLVMVGFRVRAFLRFKALVLEPGFEGLVSGVARLTLPRSMLHRYSRPHHTWKKTWGLPRLRASLVRVLGASWCVENIQNYYKGLNNYQ